MIKTPYFYVYSRQSFAVGTTHIYCEKQAHNRSSFTKEMYFSKREKYLKYNKNTAAGLITSEPGHTETMTNNSAFRVPEQEKKTIHKLHNEKHNRINREVSFTSSTWS